MYIFHPRARRAHRNCPTYIHPPIVGMIYPIPTYIVRRLPKLLAAYIQYKSYNSKTYITQLCAKGTKKPFNLLRVLKQRATIVPKCMYRYDIIFWLVRLQTFEPRAIFEPRATCVQARRALGAEGHIRTACPRTACNNCPKVYAYV